jgi:hypothetical protein
MMAGVARASFPAVLMLVATLACDGGVSSSGGPAATSEARPAVDPQLASAVDRGRELFFGEAACMACHKVGDEGKMIVGPNLGVGDDMAQPVAVRAKAQQPQSTPAEYLVQSILDPDAVVVQGYPRSVMRPLDALPQGKKIDDEMLADLTLFVMASGDAAALDPDATKQVRAAITAAQRP